MAEELRCVECGKLAKFPSEAASLMFRQCALCGQNLPEATPLGIPLPHRQIPNSTPYPLCEARISVRGEARRCEQVRLNSKNTLCRFHLRQVQKYGKLTYGRFQSDSSSSVLKKKTSQLQPMSHEMKVKRKQQADASRDVNNEDRMVIHRIFELWQRHDNNIKLKGSPFTVETIKKLVEPSLGVNLENDDPGRTAWLKGASQAVATIPKGPLIILFAFVGHPGNPFRARSVINPLCEIMKSHGGNRLHLPANGTDLLRGLRPQNGEPLDPCPESSKFLKIRYVLDGVLGHISRRLNSDNALDEDILLETRSDSRKLHVSSKVVIVKANFGHNQDFTRQFDVTERIQGIVDTRGKGGFLELHRSDNLCDHFGDPCAGVGKVLQVAYKIEPKRGEILVAEANNRLVSSIHVAAPFTGSSLIIMLATLSPKATIGRNFGILANDTKLGLIHQTVHGRHGQKTSIRCIDDKTIDVTNDLRKTIDSLGGEALRAQKRSDVFDLIFNSCPDSLKECFQGQELLLHIEFRANGVLKEEKIFTDKFHRLTSDISIDVRPREPAISIHAAVFGHPTNKNLQANVKDQVLALVMHNNGRSLHISCNDDLEKLFGDPCFPSKVNKVLQIRFEVLEKTGRYTAQVNEKGHLGHALRIGCPQTGVLPSVSK